MNGMCSALTLCRYTKIQSQPE